jgi:hypothetical protein
MMMMMMMMMMMINCNNTFDPVSFTSETKNIYRRIYFLLELTISADKLENSSGHHCVTFPGANRIAMIIIQLNSLF